MKNKLLALTFALGAIGGLSSYQANEEKELGINAGLIYGDWKNETYSGDVGTDKVFDEKSIGFDLHAVIPWHKNIDQVIGYNRIEFGGDTYTDETQTTTSLEDVNMSAAYTGFVFKTNDLNGWYLYGKGEYGFSFLSDSDHSISDATGPIGTEKAFDGGTDSYGALGAGLAYKVKDSNWTVDINYMRRDYGSFEGNRPNTQFVFSENVDAVVDSWGLNIGYNF